MCRTANVHTWLFENLCSSTTTRSANLNPESTKDALSAGVCPDLLESSQCSPDTLAGFAKRGDGNPQLNIILDWFMMQLDKLLLML